MRRVTGAVPLGVSLLIAVGAVVLLAYSSSLNPIDAILGRGAVVTVPDLDELARPRAVAEAENAGLVPVVDEGYSLTAPRGTVIDQAPKAGSRVREGERVTITVSRGAKRVQMPDAVGKPLDEVVPPLEDAGVPFEVVEVAEDEVAQGVVVTQSPAAGVEVTGDDTVRFEVSTGPADRPVPEIVGLTVDAAGFQLGVAGLTLGELTPTADPTVPSGAVVSADPPAGTVVDKDTAVSFVYSLGPAAVRVPDVANRTANQAVAALEAAGFTVVRAGRLVSDEPGSGAGAVFQQYPPAGTELQPGQPVTIVVGRIAPPPPPTTTIPAPTTTAATTTTRPGDD